MRKKRPDFILLFTILILVMSGLIIILSASSIKGEQLFSNSYYFFYNQLKYLLVAVISSVVIYKLKYEKLKLMAPYFLLISLGLLILVLIPGIGKMTGGSRRWLPLGPINFQPSELAKLTLVIYLAAYTDRNKDKMKNFKKGILPPLIVSGLILFLILIEPDLGTTITLSIVAAVMIFIGGIKILNFIVIGISFLLLSFGAIISEPYRRERLLVFLNPWQDPLDSGYHIIQSLLALGSGGLFGVGAGNSHQKFLYLPEPGTDFIFAVLGEEFGLIGTLFIVTLYFILSWRGLRIAARVEDPFASMLAVGITSMIVIQALINMAVVTSLMPVTGITLPLISYGGSSLVINLTALSLLLNISCYVEG